ncbi:hypothetical protein JL720_10322 [Aureococcus anophagefferens]|nr:hypothetical protein JL720_10322 [Aureococcus anophagefferens]
MCGNASTLAFIANAVHGTHLCRIQIFNSTSIDALFAFNVAHDAQGHVYVFENGLELRNAVVENFGSGARPPDPPWACPGARCAGAGGCSFGVGDTIEACGSRDDGHAEIFWFANPRTTLAQRAAGATGPRSPSTLSPARSCGGPTSSAARASTSWSPASLRNDAAAATWTDLVAYKVSGVAVRAKTRCAGPECFVVDRLTAGFVSMVARDAEPFFGGEPRLRRRGRRRRRRGACGAPALEKAARDPAEYCGRSVHRVRYAAGFQVRGLRDVPRRAASISPAEAGADHRSHPARAFHYQRRHCDAPYWAFNFDRSIDAGIAKVAVAERDLREGLAVADVGEDAEVEELEGPRDEVAVSLVAEELAEPGGRRPAPRGRDGSGFARS